MKEQNDGKQITEDFCKLSKARREEIENPNASTGVIQQEYWSNSIGVLE